MSIDSYLPRGERVASLLSELPYARGVGLEGRGDVVLDFVLVLARVRCLVLVTDIVDGELFAFVGVCASNILWMSRLVIIMAACVTEK